MPINTSNKDYNSTHINTFSENPEKTTDLAQVIEKRYKSHNVVHLALIEIRPHNISGDRH
jgi:hypothetical protein